jgi:hypothetical protein
MRGGSCAPSAAASPSCSIRWVTSTHGLPVACGEPAAAWLRPRAALPQCPASYPAPSLQAPLVVGRSSTAWPATAPSSSGGATGLAAQPADAAAPWSPAPGRSAAAAAARREITAAPPPPRSVPGWLAYGGQVGRARAAIPLAACSGPRPRCAPHSWPSATHALRCPAPRCCASGRGSARSSQARPSSRGACAAAASTCEPRVRPQRARRSSGEPARRRACCRLNPTHARTPCTPRYLEDGTLEVVEPREENSGLQQGRFLRRQRWAPAGGG